MVRSVQHEMLPQPTPDESARQEFVVAFKQSLNRDLRRNQSELFETVVAPRWAAEHGQPPASRDEIRAAMQADPSYRAWSTLARAAQEQMWVAMGDSVFRERARLSATAKRLHDAPTRRGSLDLDPNFVAPRGVTAVDIHLQTGGYALDLGDGDCSAGALYECGGNLYAFGQGISRTDSKADHVQRFIAHKFPNLRPRHILDMGCSAGSASVPYALAFPQSEVHAIDVGSGMLRYAHARAESLGAAVHFHQMDCAATRFEDESFDLIVSHNMMHEISGATRRGMLRESRRLLRPGGLCVHQDVPLRFKGLSEFKKFEMSWDTLHNNEPFWEVYANGDLEPELRAAGFDADCIHVGSLEAAQGSLPWFVACGWRKP
ncbi:MAG: class I SAM-dependent methyltransferase [Gammaproteobacteria bacterium]|jgi:SAM-dependent methyltransferase|nr:class I SAM-dependent methyltransferase [Gammaproteobacteria bacterium]